MTTGPRRASWLARAAVALRVHTPDEADTTDAAVLARRVETSADAIAAITRGDVPVSVRRRIDASGSALDLLITAQRHGIHRADLDGVMTLAGSAVDAIVAHDRHRTPGVLVDQRAGIAERRRSIRRTPGMTPA